MKICGKCRQEKDLSEFSKNSGRKDGLSGYCKPCMKISRRKHYDENYLKVRSEIMARRVQLRKFIREYKSSVGCMDCGNADSRVLDFDHLPEFEKEFNLSSAIQRGYGIDKMMSEIKKCEVVCANCHRIRTVTRLDKQSKTC